MVALNIKPYCNCHSTGKWHRQDGYALDRASGWWVHTRCRKPSQMNYMRNAMGLEQIPQTVVEKDIYLVELYHEAKKTIDAELGWDEPLWMDESNGWNWDIKDD